LAFLRAWSGLSYTSYSFTKKEASSRNIVILKRQKECFLLLLCSFLPSSPVGGSFVVSHRGECETFTLGAGGDAAYDCHFVCHYADCEHELKRWNPNIAWHSSTHYVTLDLASHRLMMWHTTSCRKSLERSLCRQIRVRYSIGTSVHYSFIGRTCRRCTERL
jgi:hypothetical protein